MTKPARTMKELEKQIQKEVNKMKIKVPVSTDVRSGGMVRLNKNEEELLKILKEAYEQSDASDYQVDLKVSDLPAYITPSIKELSEELKRAGYIARADFYMGGNFPYIITPSLLSYFDDKAKIEADNKSSTGITYNVGSIKADGSNVVLGDVINSSLDIDNSIKNIYEKIESDGKEDTEELKALMSEVEKVVDEIKIRGVIPKNKGLMDKLSNHLEKHGWFYGGVINLIGAAVLQFVG